MTEKNKARLKLISGLAIFGTIGVFSRYVPMPSTVIAMARGIVGTIFLVLVTVFTKKKLAMDAIKKNGVKLFLSGAMLGINWILLFEAYKYTTVATATLFYYCAPILVVIAAPFFLKEKFTLRKFACVLVAMVGMVCISGITKTGLPTLEEARGLIFGFLAAIFYAAILIMNVKIKDVPSYDRTVIQIAASAVVLTPYCLLAEDMSKLSFTPYVIVMLIVAGVLYTGIAYLLYFSSMGVLESQTIAILGYVDPVIAVILSAVVLKEDIGIIGFVGAALIIGAAIVSEISPKDNKKP